MISKEQFVDSFLHEIKVIQHLGTKITPAMLDYRPTEKQRSTQELMQYLGNIFISMTKMAIAADSSIYPELLKEATGVTLENFSETMKGQGEFVKEKVLALPDDVLAEVITLFGFEMPRSMHILNQIKVAAAYKTQLFLYAKVNGAHEIGTSNLWGGMDMPPQV